MRGNHQELLTQSWNMMSGDVSVFGVAIYVCVTVPVVVGCRRWDLYQFKWT